MAGVTIGQADPPELVYLAVCLGSDEVRMTTGRVVTVHGGRRWEM